MREQRCLEGGSTGDGCWQRNLCLELQLDMSAIIEVSKNKEDKREASAKATRGSHGRGGLPIMTGIEPMKNFAA
jgi:hypothetical protein